MSDKYPQCAKCPFDPKERLCLNPGGKSPGFCPTRKEGGIREASLAEYRTPELEEFFVQSTNRGAPMPRLMETVEFARRMKYKRLGLIFCMSLRREAEVVERFFRAKGFEVASCMCKEGRNLKEDIGREDLAPRGNNGVLCNPVMQAEVMNKAGTEFNVVLGLCVGHDSIVFQYSKAPCTVLAAKDNVLGHNPMAAVYTLDSCWKSLWKEG